MAPRNPDWNRDELILALDAYVRWRGNPPAKTSPEIAALSRNIGQLAVALGVVARSETYRNTNGVYMKLMNFRRFDPIYVNQGHVGLPRGNQLEEVVWRELAGEPDRLARIAAAIVQTSGYSESGSPSALDLLTNDEEEAIEGRMLTVVHKRRERSRQLVNKKKSAALKHFGHLACEVCAFDFLARYGERGAGFIECHHVQAIETLGDGTPTRLQDLALLCANCHRMVHACRPWLTLAELGKLIRH